MQVLAFLDHFGIADDDPRVNPYGGAIAVGHPLASSGVRLMTQLARQFEEHPEVRYGLTAMCIGIGMGGTVIWENPHWTGDDGRDDERAVSDMIDFPDEVVTSAPVRYVDLPRRRRHRRADHPGQRLRPHQADHVRARRAWPTSTPPSTRRSAATTSWRSRVTGKPFIFAVGADLTGDAGRRHRREQAQATSAGSGHASSRSSRDATVPTFAFVNGAAMGGGLELALHCHYRTLSAGVPALALPEVFLGLVPGWGGSQLLPNLIGADERRHGHRREPAEPEPDAQGHAGLRARHRRRAVRAGRLPRAVAGLGRRRSSRGEIDGRAPRGRPRRGLGRGARPRPRASPTCRCTARRPAPYQALELIDAGPHRVVRRGHRRRGRGARRPRSWATSCGPGSTRSTSCSAAPSGRPARRTRRWPARSPRSASSAPG